VETLLVISDADFGLSPEYSDLPLREAARAVIFNGDKIALMHVSNDGYYKLPGGGMEASDNGCWKTAAARESLEETGCIVEMREPIGQITEYRGHGHGHSPKGLKQVSYCGIAHMLEDTGNVQLDEAEIAEGLKLVWVTLDEALALCRQADETKYGVKFMKKRDIAFLEEAQRIMEAR